jgi:hypothetical protein
MQDKVSYEQLIAFAAGELEAIEAARVEQYLKTHLEAARTVARYRALRNLMKSTPPDSPSRRAASRAKSIFKGSGKKKPPNSHNCAGIVASYAESVLRYPAALKYRLCFALDELFGRLSVCTARWSPRLVLLLFVLAVALYARGGVAAAQNSLPGETFYPVKRTVETFRVALAHDPDYRRDLRIGLARERLRETRVLLARERYDRIAEALGAYEIHISNATRDMTRRENLTERSTARESALQISLVELRNELQMFGGIGAGTVVEAVQNAIDFSNERINALAALNQD